MGVFLHHRRRIRNAGFLQHDKRPGGRFLPAHTEMLLQRFRNLRLDCQHRVKTCERILEDHGNLVAADLVELLFRNRQQVPALIQCLSVEHRAVSGKKTHHGETGNTLPASRFSNNTENFSLIDVKTDIVSDDPVSEIALEPHSQFLHIQ